MEIQINGTPVHYQVESEKTVGELLGAIESECEKSGMTITGIRADGAVVPADALDALFARDIASIERIELETVSGPEILETLRNVGSYFSDCAPLLREIPVQLQTGKDMRVMETINGFSTNLQNMYRLLPLLPLTGLDAGGPDVDGTPLARVSGDLAPILSELLDGLKNKDTVLVGDISEYELAPRIERLGAVLQAI